MHSKRYEDAKKEFWNCVWLSPIGLFIPLWNAFKIWKPIMDEELELEKQEGDHQCMVNGGECTVI